MSRDTGWMDGFDLIDLKRTVYNQNRAAQPFVIQGRSVIQEEAKYATTNISLVAHLHNDYSKLASILVEYLNNILFKDM